MGSDSKWRNYAAPIIARVLKETAGKSEKEIRDALRAAYPFGQAKYHPYKMWCKEVRVQRFPHKRTRAERKRLAEEEAAKGPAKLFEGQE